MGSPFALGGAMFLFQRPIAGPFVALTVSALVVVLDALLGA
jgi:hypothetical protein